MRAWAASSLVPLLVLVPAMPAKAETALVWRCVQQFDESFHVRCAPSRDGTGSMEGPTTGETAGPRNDMRPVAERGLVEVYSTEAWLVPLHSRPSDPALVAELLGSVLCGKHPACTVTYGLTAPRIAGR